MKHATETDLAGRTLANRYDILALIGIGGMGAVYRARDRELDELVALKVIRSELADDPAIVARFRHEVKLARRVTHVNVARTFELGSADDLMFCTMELIDGESLTRRLGRQRRLSVPEAVTIVCAVCDALTAAHAVGVIHRDIKPDNVLISTTGRVVLADFGIASISVEGRGDLSGTPAYMAPEQARGEAPTPATDVYAVGVLLYEMISGLRAFHGDAAAIITAKQSSERLALPPSTDLEPQLAEVIGAATARDVAQRIPTATMLRARLGQWANATPLHAEVAAIGSSDHVRTVLVLAPQASGDPARLYLADAVHEALLRRLGQLAGLRVLSRAGTTPEPDATVVALHAGAVLTVSVSSPTRGQSTTLHVPLGASQISKAATAAANAITSSLGLDLAATGDPSSEALDLILQARHISQRDVSQIDHAVALLERASALLPDDPRLAANLAILQVRRAFFAPEVSAELIARSRALVEKALAAAPRLAEAHLAAGHLELNLGEVGIAAGHYRVAISCAPQAAEGHESLGRILLEAGFLEAGFARLDEAIAISPSLYGVRWDIARAFALEQRWGEHDELMIELQRVFGHPARSLPLRLRFATWRGDLARVAEIRTEPRSGFDDAFITAAFAVYVDRDWAGQRETILARGLDPRASVRWRRSFFGQIAAEVAGFAGDVPACMQLIEYATDHGMFDLHWLDRCPLLADVRASRSFAQHRARVKQRADAILDAFYGDHQVGGLSDTVAASLP